MPFEAQDPKNKKGYPVVALELELNLKSKARYQELFRHYESLKGISHLWYVVPELKMGEKLYHYWQKEKRNHQENYFVWSKLSDVIQFPEKVSIHNFKESYILNDVCESVISPILEMTQS